MRSKSPLLLLGMALILLFVNGKIWWHERELAAGHTVLLKLLPQDPRSLLQGDYMRLRYELAERIEPEVGGGRVYLRPDSDGVAQNPVSSSTDGAVPLKYRLHNGKVVFDIESFFFQEGMGSRYQRARYVELRVNSQGVPHIVQLRDEELEAL